MPPVGIIKDTIKTILNWDKDEITLTGNGTSNGKIQIDASNYPLKTVSTTKGGKEFTVNITYNADHQIIKLIGTVMENEINENNYLYDSDGNISEITLGYSQRTHKSTGKMKVVNNQKGMPIELKGFLDSGNQVSSIKFEYEYF